MSTHTPGPWITDGKVIFNVPSNVVGVIVNKDIADGYKTRVVYEESQANARLIAASPDLLESLHECLESLHECIEEMKPHNGVLPMDYSDVVSRAESAIAKAEGR